KGNPWRTLGNAILPPNPSKQVGGEVGFAGLRQNRRFARRAPEPAAERPRFVVRAHCWRLVVPSRQGGSASASERPGFGKFQRIRKKNQSFSFRACIGV